MVYATRFPVFWAQVGTYSGLRETLCSREADVEIQSPRGTTDQGS